MNCLHAQSNNIPERPKLVVGLVLDQMRWDYLYRYQASFDNNGFRRLMKDGNNFENAYIPYSPAVTAAGHTSIYTGTVPAIHGIVGNEWMERAGRTYMYCSDDSNVTGVGSASPQGKMSPLNLLTTTIGDELRLATNFRSRVYGIAMKDRGGIFAAGRSANAAYWFDDVTGKWISSSWYMQQLPAWVDAFNRSNKTDSLMNIDWKLSRDISAYDQSTADDMPFERTITGESKPVFPHVYKRKEGGSYYALRNSPYGNTLTFQFAKELIANERLGDSTTDMICISMSSTDYIGHAFGPNSIEVQDMYMRMDKELGEFLNYLDKQLGKDNYLLFLSADHGAPHIPAFMKESKLPGTNLNAYTGLLKELNKIGSDSFGVNNLVKKVIEYQVYFDLDLIKRSNVDINALSRVVVNHLDEKPEVLKAFPLNEFDKVILPAAVKARIQNGYHFKRSGDIQFIYNSQITDGSARGTDHGTVYNYDTHIPLIFYGWKIKPGNTSREVYMTDIAPTLAALLKVQAPGGSIGKALTEIVK